MKHLTRTVPLGILLTYRSVPPSARRLLGGNPSSHLALAEMRAGGNGWVSLWRWGRPGFLRKDAGGFFDDWGT